MVIESKLPLRADYRTASAEGQCRGPGSERVTKAPSKCGNPNCESVLKVLMASGQNPADIPLIGPEKLVKQAEPALSAPLADRP